MSEPTPLPVRCPNESDLRWLLRRAEHLRRTDEVLRVAFSQRDSDARALASWRQAAAQFHAACELMYPQAFWEDVRRLTDGDVGAIEPALIFLEADPWCFRSGYAKETLVRLLRRHRLVSLQRERLEAVLLRVVEAGDRREFTLYCKLAAVNATATLRDELKRRLFSDERGVSRRALLMLTALPRPRLTPSQVTRARQIILENEERSRWPRDWMRRLTRRFWSEDWGQELMTLALAGGDDAPAALRVMRGAPSIELDLAQRQQLTRLLIAAVDHGGDESWFESLARRLGPTEVLKELEVRQGHGDDQVRRRASWAINAARGAHSAPGP